MARVKAFNKLEFLSCMNEIHLFEDFFFNLNVLAAVAARSPSRNSKNPGKSSDLSIKIKAQHQVQTLMFRNLSFLLIKY